MSEARFRKISAGIMTHSLVDIQSLNKCIHQNLIRQVEIRFIPNSQIVKLPLYFFISVIKVHKMIFHIKFYFLV